MNAAPSVLSKCRGGGKTGKAVALVLDMTCIWVKERNKGPIFKAIKAKALWPDLRV